MKRMLMTVSGLFLLTAMVLTGILFTGQDVLGEGFDGAQQNNSRQNDNSNKKGKKPKKNKNKKGNMNGNDNGNMNNAKKGYVYS